MISTHTRTPFISRDPAPIGYRHCAGIKINQALIWQQLFRVNLDIILTDGSMHEPEVTHNSQAGVPATSFH